MANVNTMLNNRQVLLQKFYVYDPGVSPGDEFGGLRVIEDEKADNALHVLAARPMIQYWIDQGLCGSEPLSKVSGAGKKFLAQITRGRTETDDDPKRIPRYSKATQSGAPTFAAAMAPYQQRQQARAGKRRGDKGKADAREKVQKKQGTSAPQRPQSPSTPQQT